MSHQRALPIILAVALTASCAVEQLHEEASLDVAVSVESRPAPLASVSLFAMTDGDAELLDTATTDGSGWTRIPHPGPGSYALIAFLDAGGGQVLAAVHEFEGENLAFATVALDLQPMDAPDKTTAAAVGDICACEEIGSWRYVCVETPYGSCSDCWFKPGSCAPPPPPPPYCGDGTCNGTETCSSCSADCGTCTCPTSCSGRPNGAQCGSACEGICWNSTCLL